MKRKAAFITSTILTASLLGGIYAERARIGAWFWHVRHGDSVSVGSYVVPVPRNWTVESEPDGGQVLVRLDTNDHTALKTLKAHASMLLLLQRPLTDQDLERLVSLEAASMKQKGIEPLVQKTFETDNTKIVCLGGDQPGSAGTFDVEPRSWRCKSPAGLQITILATDPDADQVWEIVSGIRNNPGNSRSGRQAGP